MVWSDRQVRSNVDTAMNHVSMHMYFAFIFPTIIVIFLCLDSFLPWLYMTRQIAYVNFHCSEYYVGLMTGHGFFLLQAHSCPECAKEIFPNGEELYLTRQTAKT